MRPHPLLRRLAARTGAAFRCAERLESREDFGQLLAPDLEAAPLVAAERLRALVAPADGSKALQRSLDRIVAAPAAESEKGSESRRPDWTGTGGPASPALGEESGEEVGTRHSRPAPRTPRAEPSFPRRAAAGAGASPVPAPSRAQVQGILDRAARAVQPDRETREPGVLRPGSLRGRSGSGGAGWIGRAPEGLPAAREKAAPPLLGPSLGRGFLLDRAARTPLVIDDPGASLAALLAAPPSKGGGAAGPEVKQAGESGAPRRLGGSRDVLALGGPDSSSSPALPRAAFSADYARAQSPHSVRPGAGGLRGLAALAEAEGLPSPPAPPSRFAGPPRGDAEGDGDPTALDGLQRAPRALAADFDRPFSEALAPPTPLSPDLEALLDQALRRAARRHGIEVLEP